MKSKKISNMEFRRAYLHICIPYGKNLGLTCKLKYKQAFCKTSKSNVQLTYNYRFGFWDTLSPRVPIGTLCLNLTGGLLSQTPYCGV